MHAVRHRLWVPAWNSVLNTRSEQQHFDVRCVFAFLLLFFSLGFSTLRPVYTFLSRSLDRCLVDRLLKHARTCVCDTFLVRGTRACTRRAWVHKVAEQTGQKP